MQYGYRIVGEGSRNQPHLQKLASPPNYTDHQRKWGQEEKVIHTKFSIFFQMGQSLQYLGSSYSRYLLSLGPSTPSLKGQFALLKMYLLC